MRFRFTLAAVLRLREIEEQREERLLTQILAQLAQARAEVLSLEAQIVEVVRQRETRLAGTASAPQSGNTRDLMAAVELQSSYALAAMLGERRDRAREQVARVEQTRDQQLVVYGAAHRAHEMLTTMQSEQRAAFLREQSRREQASLDDGFIARMRRF